MKHIQHSTFRKQDVYTATIGGHVGYWRQAIARTPGTSEYRRGSFNGSAGSNTTIVVEFERDDEALYEELKKNYRAICQEKREKNKQVRSAQVHPDFAARLSALLPLTEPE